MTRDPKDAGPDERAAIAKFDAFPDYWGPLRQATPARIGLGRNGDAMPLRPVLDFQLSHANARDSVHAALDIADLTAAIAPHAALHVRSAAPDRMTYLKRPDLGRLLDLDDQTGLPLRAGHGYDCVFILADGLSAVAVARHAPALLAQCQPLLKGLSIAPIVIATQARVALGDPIGAALGARVSIVFIGERPGLSVADSLGVYMTFDPKPGRRDAERNCISNIHANGGLTYELAANKLTWLVREALRRKISGIALKDTESPLLAP